MLLIGLVLSCNVFALSEKRLKYSQKRYNPLHNISDITFSVKIDYLKKLLEKRVLLNKFEKFEVNAFWYEDNSNKEILIKPDVPLDIKVKLKEEISKKTQYIWGSNFSKWLEQYAAVKSFGEWTIYEDLTGLNDKVEIRIKETLESVTIIEKKPTGTITTVYSYKVFPWSKKRYALYKVKRKAYEGIQAIESSIDIEYAEIQNKYWIPGKIIAKNYQKTKVLNSNQIERNIEETTEIFNFNINNNAAKKWFAKQK